MLAIALYGVLFAVAAWPGVSDPAHVTLPSFSMDNYTNFWNLWWVSEALRQGRNVLHTSLLYHPTGTTLALTEFCPLYGVLSAPVLLDSPFAAVAAFNGWVAVSFILTGYATYLLCRWWSGSDAGSLFAGFTVAFAAYRFHHIEHMNLLSTFWLPFTAWLAASWMLVPPAGGTAPRPSRWRLVGLAACGLGMAATSYSMLAFTFLFLVVWLVGTAVLDRDRFLPGTWRRVGLVALALIGGALPLSWWWAGAFAGGSAAVDVRETINWSPDLLGFLLPQRSGILGPLFDGVRVHGSGGREAYIGVALLCAAIYGTRSRGRPVWPLLSTAMVAFLVSLGRRGFWFAGSHIGLPVMPHDVLTGIAPFFTASRTPVRFVIVTLVALAPLAAIGVRALLRRPRGALVAAVLAAVALVELMPAVAPGERVEVPPGLLALATNPRQGAVIEMPVPLTGLPVAPGEEVLGTWNLYTFHQVAHRRPVVGGPLFRPSPEAIRFLREKRFHRRLTRIRELPDALRDLKSAGVAFVIWNRGNMEPEVWVAINAAYARYAQAVYTDSMMVVYAIP